MVIAQFHTWLIHEALGFGLLAFSQGCAYRNHRPDCRHVRNLIILVNAEIIHVSSFMGALRCHLKRG